MATLVRLNANVEWQCAPAGDQWIATCEPLKLTVQSETWANLMEDIGLTLNAVFEDLLVSNELSQFLGDRGWEILGTIPNRSEEVRFDVPFFPAMMGVNGSQRELHQ